MELTPFAVKAWSLNHWTTREFPRLPVSSYFLKNIYSVPSILQKLSYYFLNMYLFTWLLWVLVTAHGSSSLTRVWTRPPCIGSAEASPLDHQGSPFSPCFWITGMLLFLTHLLQPGLLPFFLVDSGWALTTSPLVPSALPPSTSILYHLCFHLSDITLLHICKITLSF